MTVAVELERQCLATAAVLEVLRIVEADDTRVVVQFDDELPNVLAADDAVSVAAQRGRQLRQWERHRHRLGNTLEPHHRPCRVLDAAAGLRAGACAPSIDLAEQRQTPLLPDAQS